MIVHTKIIQEVTISLVLICIADIKSQLIESETHQKSKESISNDSESKFHESEMSLVSHPKSPLITSSSG